MCGIVGYVGTQQAAPILLEGLSRLEYRGYDSAGVCVEQNGVLKVEKAKGRLQNLIAKTENGALLPGTLGIGHTRWATHGAPSDENAHPQLSTNGSICIVHNGIIENFLPLKEFLLKQGKTFRSETDTEVIANLLEYYYEQENDLMKAVRLTLGRIEGSYACEGFLGGYEAEVRDHFYQCAAGVSVASIRVDGAISGCTSIRANYHQGNIYRDRFWDVWQNRFEPFRDREWARRGECADCSMFRYCQGGGMHLRGDDGELLYCHYHRL